MKHSNAKYWSESTTLAENIGAGYGNFVNENYETKFKVVKVKKLVMLKHGKLVIIEAQQTIISQLRSQYIKDSGCS
jgi:hypothetical protein